MSPAAATKACAQNGAQAATLDVIGLGDPVLDIVACIPYETLRSLHLEAGGCMAVEEPELQTLLAMPEIIQAARRVPGGSAANVCKCLAALNHTNVAFVGMVGTDAIADEYRNALRSHDVLPLLLRSVKAVTTAKCLCMVTPDGQRTMRTFLGAALEFSDPQSIPKEIGMDGLRLLHCEGYSLYRPAVTQEAMRRARAAGSRTSLDLASFEVVDRCWAVLMGLLEAGLVDILFLNEDEARAVCSAADAMVSAVADHDDAVEAAQRLLLRFVSVVVVSRGKKGCVAADRNGTRAVAAADDVKVVDTVGAGDYFSAGFLHAWLDGASLETCAKCGCACGSAAVQVEGAELPPNLAAALRCRVLTILDEENGRKNGATDDVGAPLGASNTRFYESESAR